MRDFANHLATDVPAFYAASPVDIAAGDCDNLLLQIGKWWSGGGQCRDLDAVARLENSADALDNEIKRVIATDVTGTIIPNDIRVQMGSDMLAWRDFDRRVRSSGESYWTTGSDAGTAVVVELDKHQKHIQGWRDWLANKTGHPIPGSGLPNPGLDPVPENKPGFLGGIEQTLSSATKLAMVVIGGLVVMALVRK